MVRGRGTYGRYTEGGTKVRPVGCGWDADEASAVGLRRLLNGTPETRPHRGGVPKEIRPLQRPLREERPRGNGSLPGVAFTARGNQVSLGLITAPHSRLYMIEGESILREDLRAIYASVMIPSEDALPPISSWYPPAHRQFPDEEGSAEISGTVAGAPSWSSRTAYPLSASASTSSATWSRPLISKVSDTCASVSQRPSSPR